MTIAVGDRVWVPADRNHHVATVTDQSTIPGRWRIEHHSPTYTYGWWDESSLEHVPPDVDAIFRALPGAASVDVKRRIRELAAARDGWRDTADSYRAAWHDATDYTHREMIVRLAADAGAVALQTGDHIDRAHVGPLGGGDIRTIPVNPPWVCPADGYYLLSVGPDGKVTITPQDVSPGADT